MYNVTEFNTISAKEVRDETNKLTTRVLISECSTKHFVGFLRYKKGKNRSKYVNKIPKRASCYAQTERSFKLAMPTLLEPSAAGVSEVTPAPALSSAAYTSVDLTPSGSRRWDTNSWMWSGGGGVMRLTSTVTTKVMGIP